MKDYKNHEEEDAYDPFKSLEINIMAFKNREIMTEREKIGEGFLGLVDEFPNIPADFIRRMRKIIFIN